MNPCPHKECGCYPSYDISLCCPCIRRYRTFHEYLESSNLSSLKIFYELLIMHQGKYYPLVQDILKFYKIYDINVATMDFCLEYNPNTERFILIEGQKKMEKHSRYKALFRLKKKHFMQKYKELDLSSSDDELPTS